MEGRNAFGVGLTPMQNMHGTGPFDKMEMVVCAEGEFEARVAFL